MDEWLSTLIDHKQVYLFYACFTLYFEIVAMNQDQASDTPKKHKDGYFMKICGCISQRFTLKKNKEITPITLPSNQQTSKNTIQVNNQSEISSAKLKPLPQNHEEDISLINAVEDLITHATSKNITDNLNTWVIGASSCIGLGHIHKNLPCQDNHYIQYHIR